MNDIKVLELFAGSRSIGKVAERLGMKVFSIDIMNFPNIDLIFDIEFLTTNDIPFIPDIIWASPPCQTYSIASVAHHRCNYLPISDFAKKSDSVVRNTLKIIKEFDAIYYIENPVGTLRKMPFMKGIPRTSVTYCQYGDSCMKPTDIWSNNIRSLFDLGGWQPRPMCRNGLSCHDAAPRGAKTGTQGKRNAFERSIVPEELCQEVLLAAAKRI